MYVLILSVYIVATSFNNFRFVSEMSRFVSVAWQTGLNTKTQLPVSVSIALEEKPARGTDEMLANIKKIFFVQFVYQAKSVISKFTQNAKVNLLSIKSKSIYLSCHLELLHGTDL